MKFIVPTRIILGKKKKKSYPLNANTFANRHHREKHNAKMIFYDYIKSLGLYNKNQFQNPIRLHLKYYMERNGDFDEDNVGFGIHKFTADSLVSIGLLKDDNYKFVKWPTFEVMGIDREHHFEKEFLRGRCDVEIEELRS